MQLGNNGATKEGVPPRLSYMCTRTLVRNMAATMTLTMKSCN